MVLINYLAVFVASITSMVIGFLWYGPVFGKLWIKLSGFSKEDVEKAKKKGMAKEYILMFAGSFVMSYVLAHSLVFASAYLKASGVSSGLMTGFWNWLGFVAPVTLGAVLWEGKSWKLWILNNGYYLVTLSVMGLVLSTWK
jgi:hypothetical protein